MDILLDTNFILTCVRENIHFDDLADELIDEQINWIVPQDVLNELGNLKDSVGPNSKDRKIAEVSFQILQAINPKIVELSGKNPNIDIKIVNYLLDKDIVLATLDRGLKQRINNRILTLRGRKKLELIE